MDSQPNNPYELNSSPEGELFFPNQASRQDHLESLRDFDQVLKTLWRNLDVFSRESEEPGTRLPLSVQFRLEVYENKERPWEIKAINKILHDQYTATYWKLKLNKLQMERGEKDEPMDPSSLSSGSKKKESGDDSRKDDDPLWKKIEAWRRLIAIVRTDTSSSSGHSLPNHKVQKRRKKRCRQGIPAPKATTVRRPRQRAEPRVGSWRKAMRRKRESEIELERQSSGSDPEPASPGTRRSVHCIRRPLVSEAAMTVVAMYIPYRHLNFHPGTTKFSSIEISMKGIMTAFNELGRQLTFYRKVARNMCLEIIQPESQPPVPDYLKQNLLIFLKDFFSFQFILKSIFVFLGMASRKHPRDRMTSFRCRMRFFQCYLHGIEKLILRISQSRNAIISLNYEAMKRMQEKLEDYYKAICDLKVV